MILTDRNSRDKTDERRERLENTAEIILYGSDVPRTRNENQTSLVLVVRSMTEARRLVADNNGSALDSLHVFLRCRRRL